MSGRGSCACACACLSITSNTAKSTSISYLIKVLPKRRELQADGRCILRSYCKRRQLRGVLVVGVGVGHLCCSMQKHGTDNEGCRSIHRILRMEVCGCGATLRKLNKSARDVTIHQLKLNSKSIFAKGSTVDNQRMSARKPSPRVVRMQGAHRGVVTFMIICTKDILFRLHGAPPRNGGILVSRTHTAVTCTHPPTHTQAACSFKMLRSRPNMAAALCQCHQSICCLAQLSQG